MIVPEPPAPEVPAPEVPAPEVPGREVPGPEVPGPEVRPARSMRFDGAPVLAAQAAAVPASRRASARYLQEVSCPKT